MPSLLYAKIVKKSTIYFPISNEQAISATIRGLESVL